MELAAINAMTDVDTVDGESKEKQDTVENVCYEKIQSKLFNREIRPYKVIVQIVLNSVCKVSVKFNV